VNYIGIDGCRGGWFLLGLDEAGDCIFRRLARITELDAYLNSARVVLIDIPIGLHGRHCEERLCDRQARAVLQPRRGASVFPAPSRCALPCEDYAQASQRNRDCTGRGLSRQSFALLPKIREVDDYLRQQRRRANLHEMHPEVCFWALNQQTPMYFNKKTSDGYEERVAVLSQHFPRARAVIDQALLQYRRAVLARDDIVDALVGAITARHARALCRFPDTPQHDETGLPMEIVYPCPAKRPVPARNNACAP